MVVIKIPNTSIKLISSPLYCVMRQICNLSFYHTYPIIISQVSKQCPRTYTGAFCLLEAHPQSP